MAVLDPQLRFHLKQIALAVLGSAQDICQADIDLVAKLAADPVWWGQVRGRVLWNKLTWFDALFRQGTWQEWLTGTGGPPIPAVLNLLRFVIEKRPAEVDAILKPFFTKQEHLLHLEYVAPHTPAHDSPLVAELRKAAIRAGDWEDDDIYFQGLARVAPERAIRLIDASIRGWLRWRLVATKDERRHRVMTHEPLPRDVQNAIRSNSRLAWQLYSRSLRICERAAKTARLRREKRDVHFETVFWLDQLVALLTELAGEALAGLTEQDPAYAAGALAAQQRLTYGKALMAAVMLGLTRGKPFNPDLGVGWLLSNEQAFSLSISRKRDGYALAADLIRTLSPACSDASFEKLERRLLSFLPAEEVDRYRWQVKRFQAKGTYYWGQGVPRPVVSPYGHAQHLFLSALPDGRLSPEGRERMALWNAKFGGPAREDPPLPGGKTVGSPIPSERFPKVTDRQWRAIAARDWENRERRQTGLREFSEASHRMFARSFGEAAKREPRRFAQLGLTLPETTPPDYFASLWIALSAGTTRLETKDLALIEKLLQHTVKFGNDEATRQAIWVIANHPDWKWGEDAWTFLEAASLSSDPSPVTIKIAAEDADSVDEQLDERGVSCVRGMVAYCLGRVLFQHPERLPRLQSLADRLMSDSHVAVRAEALLIVVALHTIDPDLAFDKLLYLADFPDDRLFGGQWVGEAIRLARHHRKKGLASLFSRMVHSVLPKTSREGSAWATAEFLQFDNCKELFEEAIAGTVHQRRGVAQMLPSLIDVDNVSVAECENYLAQMFDDPDKDIRHDVSSLCSMDKFFDLDSAPRIVNRLVATKAFDECADQLLYTIDKEVSNLLPFAPAVLASVDRIAGAASMREHRMTLSRLEGNLASLLLRLYDQASKGQKQDLAEQCLDRWDLLIQYGTDQAEKSLDEYAV